MWLSECVDATVMHVGSWFSSVVGGEDDFIVMSLWEYLAP